MKEIKVGAINWNVPGYKDIKNYYINKYIVGYLNILSKYKYVYVDNPYEEECHIIFYSIWGDLDNLKKCKGKPKFIFWTHEYLHLGTDKNIVKLLSNDNDNLSYEYANKIFNLYKMNNYSLSFCDDSESNLYYPYWLTEYNYGLSIYKKSCDLNYRNINNKNKFCVYICSHYSYDHTRINFVKALSNKYKNVTCPGNTLHNTGDFRLSYDKDIALSYCKDFKFYISFENAKSCNNFNYTTEKLLFGWEYGCIPLYWGDNRNINKYFNKEAYVDLSNMTQEQMINKVIELDNDNEQCQYILNQYLFNIPCKYFDDNYTYVFNKKLTIFIENILN